MTSPHKVSEAELHARHELDAYQKAMKEMDAANDRIRHARYSINLLIRDEDEAKQIVARGTQIMKAWNAKHGGDLA